MRVAAVRTLYSVRIAVIALFAAASIVSAVFAADDEAYRIVIKDNRFHPAEVTIPSGKRVKLIVDNRGDVVEEFESNDFGVEKIIPAGSSATIWVRPLDPGEYVFFGEFHMSTAQGKLIVK